MTIKRCVFLLVSVWSILILFGCNSPPAAVEELALEIFYTDPYGLPYNRLSKADTKDVTITKIESSDLSKANKANGISARWNVTIEALVNVKNSWREAKGHIIIIEKNGTIQQSNSIGSVMIDMNTF